MLTSSNFHQYIPDSVIQARSVEEIQNLIDSNKNGPIPKGDPKIDLKLNQINELPPNLKLISSRKIKF